MSDRKGLLVFKFFCGLGLSTGCYLRSGKGDTFLLFHKLGQGRASSLEMIEGSVALESMQKAVQECHEEILRLRKRLITLKSEVQKSQ